MSTKTWSYTNSKWGDVLTKFNNDNISTDAIGNPKVIGSNVLTWKGRQLQSIGFTYDPDYITYEYDMEGRRIAKDGPGGRTEFYYNGNILAGQKNGSTKIVFMYDEKGDPFGFKYNDDYYAYIKNLQNDVVAIADKDKNIVVRYTYDSWGKLLKTEGTLAGTIGKENPIRYRSYYYDTESKYYYLQSRYYDPDMCRFLNADGYVTTGQGVLSYNMFMYCNNNPIRFADDNGYLPDDRLLLNAKTYETGGYIGMLGGYKDKEYMGNGGIKVEKKTVKHVTTTKTIEYIPPNQVNEKYIEKLENNVGHDKVGYLAAGVASANYAAGKFIGKSIPYIGPILTAVEIIQLFEGFISNVDLDSFRKAMDTENGMIIIHWEIEGDPRIVGNSFTSYYSWNGTSQYGCYPFANK